MPDWEQDDQVEWLGKLYRWDGTRFLATNGMVPSTTIQQALMQKSGKRSGSAKATVRQDETTSFNTWIIGNQVQVGYLKCTVEAVWQEPRLHFHLMTTRRERMSFFPHLGLRKGWVHEP